MDQFNQLLSNESLGYVHRLAQESERMLKATLAHDTDTMAEILELKIDSTPEDAIEQIKNKKYALRFKGRIVDTLKYIGNILAVGISYDKKRKKHSCKIEVL